ncbi:MAG: hypothetical protein BWY83_02951 [bacterium ADurb.Bin478]|nr:MAG: hypothetical protein BWY83_02951 [bacterium ADurb.Bin478]
MIRLAFSATCGSTARQMECSDEAWVISMMLIWCFASTANSRPAMPETPTMPLPSMRSSAMSLMEEMPLTRNRPGAGSALIRVPAKAGLKLLRMRMGIFFSIAGCMVGGWMTLAPKCDSSMASS